MSKLLNQAVANITRDLGAKINDVAKTTASQVAAVITPALKAAVAEALPPALAATATQVGHTVGVGVFHWLAGACIQRLRFAVIFSIG